MGHVPAGPLRQAGEGHDVPRREHRRDRQPLRRQGAVADRRIIGRLGERLARHFLEQRGATILSQNLRVGRDEIDLLAAIGADRFVVEVKTTASEMNSAENLTDDQLRHLRQAGRRLRPPAARVDLVTVSVSPTGADICWFPYVG